MWLLIFITFFLFINVSIAKDEQINVLGTRLEQCSISPLTGYYRTGSCEWSGSGDYGVHTVCAQMTNQFLEFTRSHGNDLSTPQNSTQFPGLRPGDRWCLCAARWKEAFLAKVAPPVLLQSTHRITLQLVKLDDLRTYAYRDNIRRRLQYKNKN